LKLDIHAQQVVKRQLSIDQGKEGPQQMSALIFVDDDKLQPPYLSDIIPGK
jgi:hypothetical protein